MKNKHLNGTLVFKSNLYAIMSYHWTLFSDSNNTALSLSHLPNSFWTTAHGLWATILRWSIIALPLNNWVFWRMEYHWLWCDRKIERQTEAQHLNLRRIDLWGASFSMPNASGTSERYNIMFCSGMLHSILKYLIQNNHVTHCPSRCSLWVIRQCCFHALFWVLALILSLVYGSLVLWFWASVWY